MHSLLQIKLNLSHLIVAKYIHDEAWNEADLENLGKKTASDIVLNMVADMWINGICPVCLQKFESHLNNIDHSRDCKLAEWLRVQGQSQRATNLNHMEDNPE